MFKKKRIKWKREREIRDKFMGSFSFLLMRFYFLYIQYISIFSQQV